MISRPKGPKACLRLASALGALTTSTIATPAIAQVVSPPADTQAPADTQDAGLEEIIVTAQRRAERLQDTPIAVSVLSGAELRSRNIDNITQVSQSSPNVYLSGAARSSGGGSNIQAFIRGIGQGDFILTTEAGVGAYLDGVYIGRTSGALIELSDIERVEVLRGPQGTLFGRNTIGGAINIISRKPEKDFGLSASATYGTDNLVVLESTLNVPLDDTVGFRLAGKMKDQDGYGRSTFTGQEFGNENKSVIRGSLQWRPSDSVTLDLNADYSRARENGPTVAVIEVIPSNGSIIAVNAVRDPDITEADEFTDPFRNSANVIQVNELDVWGVGGTLAWQVTDDITVKSITAYRELKTRFLADIDGTRTDYSSIDFNVQQQQFSQELQLDGQSFDNALKWIVGAYYFNEKGRELGFVRIIPTLADVTQDGRIDTKTVAVFGQATWYPFDGFGLTAGLRYNRDRKDYTYSAVRTTPGAPPVVPLTSRSATFESTTPRLGVEYKLTPDILLYASYSQGFKSGGFNGRAFAPSQLSSFNPEKVKAYEIGAKIEAFDRRVRLNVAAFKSDYKDIQLTVARAPAGGGPGFVSTVENAGAAEINGFEAELTAQVIPAFLVTGSVGYLDAKYTDGGAAPGVLPGNALPNAPRWQTSISAQYTIDAPSVSGSFVLRADYNRRSSFNFDGRAFLETRQDAYGLLGARASYRRDDERWGVSIWARNLTDETYLQSAFKGGGGLNWGTFARPREIGVTLEGRFN